MLSLALIASSFQGASPIMHFSILSLSVRQGWGIAKCIIGLAPVVNSGSLAKIDYSKHICLAHPLTFECSVRIKW